MTETQHCFDIQTEDVGNSAALLVESSLEAVPAWPFGKSGVTGAEPVEGSLRNSVDDAGTVAGAEEG